MNRLVEYELSDGNTILVEIDIDDDNYTDELIPVANPNQIAAKASQTFEQAIGAVRQVAVSVADQVENLPRRPDEVTVEFAIKLTGGANIIFASGSADANFGVSLTWRRAGGPTESKP